MFPDLLFCWMRNGHFDHGTGFTCIIFHVSCLSLSCKVQRCEPVGIGKLSQVRSVVKFPKTSSRGLRGCVGAIGNAHSLHTDSASLSHWSPHLIDELFGMRLALVGNFAALRDSSVSFGRIKLLPVEIAFHHPIHLLVYRTLSARPSDCFSP